VVNEQSKRASIRASALFYFREEDGGLREVGRHGNYQRSERRQELHPWLSLAHAQLGLLHRRRRPVGNGYLPFRRRHRQMS